MKFLRPLPRRVTRPLSILVLLAWVATMVVLVHRSFVQASSANLASDLARYGSAAQWRGVYYRNEKIGFTVSQTVATDDGLELQEDGRLQMSLLGAQTAAAIRTTARVDRAFTLQSFEFSLDPGTGATTVRGQVDGTRLRLSVTSPSGTRSEVREIAEPPVLALTLARRLAAAGLTSGAHYKWIIFDPATMSSAPVALDIGRREVVHARRTVAIRDPDVRAGVSRGAAVRRAPHHVLDYRHRRGRARAEPDGARDRARIARARASDGGALQGPRGSARGLRGRARLEAPRRQPARRAPPPHAADRRGSVEPRSPRRRPERRRGHRGDPRSPGPAARSGRPGCRPLPDTRSRSSRATLRRSAPRRPSRSRA